MSGDNTDENQYNFFKEQVEGLLIDSVNDRFDFYKKIDENPSVKNMILRKMHSEYQKAKFQS